MDWLQFFAAVIGHLAWPSVLIVLLIVLRKQIGSLAERIEEFSFGNAKFVWKKKLEEGAEILQTLPPPLNEIEQQPRLKLDTPLSSAKPRLEVPERFSKWWDDHGEASPSAFVSVLAALSEIDKLLVAIGEKLEGKPSDPVWVMLSMAMNKMVPDDVVQLYHTLRDAKNAIAHSPAFPSTKEATEYLRQASYMISVLEHLLDMFPKDPTRGNSNVTSTF